MKTLPYKKIMEEMYGISEAGNYYARDPKGKQISVFTDKDNWKDAVKTQGYDAVDREEAEAELAGKAKAPEKPQAKPKVTKIAADPFADKKKATGAQSKDFFTGYDTDIDPERPSDEPEDSDLEKIDSEIADIEDQRRILKQYMTSSGGGGVSSSRADQLEKQDKELVAKWRELQQARMDLDPPVYGDDEPKVPAPDSRSDTGKPRVSANPYDDNYGEPEDAPSPSDPHFSYEGGEVDDAIYGALEGIADAAERGIGFDHPAVKKMVLQDFNTIKDTGGTVQDIADQVKAEAEYMNLEDLELIDAAAEEIFGEKVPHGLSGNNYDESVKPWKNQYNRLFESVGTI